MKRYSEDKVDQMRQQKDEELEQYKKEIERNIWRDLQINKTSIRKFFINPQPQSLVNLKKPTRILIVKFDTPVNTFLAVN